MDQAGQPASQVRPARVRPTAQTTRPEPPASVEPPPPLTPLPEGVPANPEAARLLESARRLLRDRQSQKAVAPLEQAAAIEATHLGIQRLLIQTRIDARRAEIEALTSAALNHFVANEYAKARKAVDKALALDPNNKKAKELNKILVALA
jgi:tetratricopeptide (TPR) repeat protein